MSDFCGSFGVNTKVGYADSGAIDAAVNAPTTRMEILTENLVFPDSIVGSQGITGLVDDSADHLREGARMVQGGFVTEVGPNELDPWISAIVRNTNADQTKETLDDAPKDITVLRDKVAHAYRYCVSQECRIRCQSDPNNAENTIMKLAMSFLGIEETATTFPAQLALPTGNRYFWLMGDSTFTYNGVVTPIDSFEIRVQNQIVPLFRSRLRPGCFRSIGRMVTLDIEVPYSATTAAALFGANDTNRQAVITMGSGNLPTAAAAYETVFTFGSTRRISKAANTTGKDEVPLRVQLQSYQTGATPALAITNTITA